MNQLAVIEQLKPIEIYAPEKVDEILSKITEQVKEFKPDISTERGRKEIASLAYKIAQSKTFLDNCGKMLGEDHKKALDTINVERKKIRENLDALKEEARKPLTDWEISEEKRKEVHKQDLIRLETLGQHIGGNWSNTPIEDIQQALFVINDLKAKDWEDYKEDAETVIATAEGRVSTAMEAKKLHDEQQAELQKLRAEKEQRDRDEADRLAKAQEEARIKYEAEQKLIEEAKAKADEDKRVADQLKRDEAARVEKERAVAYEKEQSELKLKAAAAKAEKDKADALAKAAKEKEEALAKERKRINDERLALEAAEAKRQANMKHNAKINNEVLKALQAQGVSEADGVKVITAIVKGLIPHTKISY